jgi:hypothetical protein
VLVAYNFWVMECGTGKLGWLYDDLCFLQVDTSYVCIELVYLGYMT